MLFRGVGVRWGVATVIISTFQSSALFQTKFQTTVATSHRLGRAT